MNQAARQNEMEKRPPKPIRVQQKPSEANRSHQRPTEADRGSRPSAGRGVENVYKYDASINDSYVVCTRKLRKENTF